VVSPGGRFRGRTGQGKTNLERSADAEDTVVGFLGRQALDSALDNGGLLGDQVIESGRQSVIVGLEEIRTQHPKGPVGRCDSAVTIAKVTVARN
jgi:hypothetical protein